MQHATPKHGTSIGADHVIDYTKEDFTKSGERYDLIFAVNGNLKLTVYQRALNPQGVYVCAGGALPQIMQANLLGPLVSIIARKKMGFMGIAKPNQKDLIYMAELLEAGKVAPVIEKCYPSMCTHGYLPWAETYELLPLLAPCPPSCFSFHRCFSHATDSLLRDD